MEAADFLPATEESSRVLWGSIIAALALETIILVAVGTHEHWLPRAAKPVDESNFIEAQVFVPPETHLTEEKAQPAVAKPEATISKVANKGREAKPSEKVMPEENKTEGGPPLAPTHGPIATFSPSPKLPSYLQEADLHASVVIDFYVKADGSAEPRLAGSSGNEELDALALETAKKWKFRAGEQDHKAIDSKVRLRIVFDVQ
jgi:TonB family protein